MIFIHGVQFANVSIILKYKKKYPSVRILCDNHADWINSARNLLSKKILHGIIWRYYANKIEPYVTRFYGVTPLRCEFFEKRCIIFLLQRLVCWLWELMIGGYHGKIEMRSI